METQTSVGIRNTDACTKCVDAESGADMATSATEIPKHTNKSYGPPPVGATSHSANSTQSGSLTFVLQVVFNDLSASAQWLLSGASAAPSETNKSKISPSYSSCPQPPTTSVPLVRSGSRLTLCTDSQLMTATTKTTNRYLAILTTMMKTAFAPIVALARMPVAMCVAVVGCGRWAVSGMLVTVRTAHKTASGVVAWVRIRTTAAWSAMGRLYASIAHRTWVVCHAMQLDAEVRILRQELSAANDHCMELKSQNKVLTAEREQLTHARSEAEGRYHTLRTAASSSRARAERAMQNLNRTLSKMPAPVSKAAVPSSVSADLQARPLLSGDASKVHELHALSSAA